jgi:nitrate reductase delta subunit
MNCVMLNECLTGLLRYPDRNYRERLGYCCTRLEQEAPELAERLRAAALVLEQLTLAQMQEQFTQSFDLNPVCSLEIGWHLFGENYDRGALMARLRGELRRHGIRENGELPDHLSQVMPLLARMEPAEAQDFFAACVAPALAKMQAAFRTQPDVPYAVILNVICQWLQRQYGALVKAIPLPLQLPILQEPFHD